MRFLTLTYLILICYGYGMLQGCVTSNKTLKFVSSFS